MQSDIFITFIVPVYRVDYIQLRRCVDSLIHQNVSKRKYEILLVDDGSPDDCGMICDEYVKLHQNIQVIHQKNKGLSVVRNNGVKASRGEWIAFVDGDDWVEKDFVQFAEQQVDLSPQETDIFIWDGFAETSKDTVPIKFLDSDNIFGKDYSGADKEILIDRIIPRYVRKSDIRRCTDIGITWGRIYRKAMLVDNDIINIPGLKVMQDSVFNLWAFEHSRSIHYQYKPVYHYSMYDESVSKKYDGTIADTMIILYRYLADYIMQFHNTEEYWQRLYVRSIRLIVKCLSKDYANPMNKDSLRNKCRKMKMDLSKQEFQIALHKCDSEGQDFKFRFILFLLKHELYLMSIFSSRVFGMIRRLKNKVS